MALIAVYWIFLFFLLLPLGVLTEKILKVEQENPIITLLLGLVLLTCGFTLTALFIPLGAVSLLLCTLASLISGIYYKTKIKQLLIHFAQGLKTLPSYLKIIIGILFFGALLKSAQYPFIIDNESYYIQTIKWLNEYGFVKGLANLHIFFAQNSAWHILQAGTNLSFLTNRINDINGFVFILCVVYCIIEGYKLNSAGKMYWLSFMPMVSIIPFLFLDVPSPDLPLLVITPIILHLYIQHIKGDSNFKIALLLFIFLASIKITILPLGLLFLPGLVKRENIAFGAVCGVPVLLLWIAKNSIISGYPFYPIAHVKLKVDWTVPKNIVDLIIQVTKDYGYKRDGMLPADTSTATKILFWVKQSGLAGIINKLTITVLFAMPFFMLKDKKHRTIYVALLVNFLAVLFTSPQFRYFLYITLSGTLFVIAALFNFIKPNVKILKAGLITGSVIVVVTFLNLGLSKLTSNKRHHQHGEVRLRQALIPEEITKYPDMLYLRQNTCNLNYYSPADNFLMFGTGDGKLPCVNKVQIDFMRRKFGVEPQLRSADIKDGFYSARSLNK
jgi:hypothetical protein